MLVVNVKTAAILCRLNHIMSIKENKGAAGGATADTVRTLAGRKDTAKARCCAV